MPVYPVQTWEITKDDWTFAQIDSNAARFGTADGCDVPTNKDGGDFKIDLRGSRFSMDPKVPIRVFTKQDEISEPA